MLMPFRGHRKRKCNTSHFLSYRLPRANLGTGAGGQFGWGGTPLKRYQRGPKFGSSGSEIHWRGQGHKLDWLDLQTHGIQRRKSGLAIHDVPTIGGSWWQKNYPRDNRLVAGESSYRPRGLVPRCRLFPSWPCSRGQGWGCSPIKGEHELGLDRRETGRTLPDGSVVAWGEVAPSTRGTEQRGLWFNGCLTRQAVQLSHLG